MATQFRKLNDGWNAEPNAPDPTVQVDGRDVVLTFLANPFQFPRFAEDQRLRLRFTGGRKYRLGSTNDEGWYRGQCRSAAKHPHGVSSTRSQAISSWTEVRATGTASETVAHRAVISSSTFATKPSNVKQMTGSSRSELSNNVLQRTVLARRR